MIPKCINGNNLNFVLFHFHFIDPVSFFLLFWSYITVRYSISFLHSVLFHLVSPSFDIVCYDLFLIYATASDDIKHGVWSLIHQVFCTFANVQVYFIFFLSLLLVLFLLLLGWMETFLAFISLFLLSGNLQNAVHTYTALQYQQKVVKLKLT